MTGTDTPVQIVGDVRDASGWAFEGPDPSVGIFGWTMLHDACPSDTDPDCQYVFVGYEGERGNRIAHYAEGFTCLACGAQLLILQREYDPEDPEDEDR